MEPFNVSLGFKTGPSPSASVVQDNAANTVL